MSDRRVAVDTVCQRAQNHIALSKEQISSIVRNLEVAQTIPDPVVKEQRVTALTNRLAELLTQIGKFADAAMITLDARRRREYQEIADAFKAGAKTRCDCPDEIVVDRQRGVQYRSRSFRTVQKVINPFTNQFVAFKKCGKCGQISAG